MCAVWEPVNQGVWERLFWLWAGGQKRVDGPFAAWNMARFEFVAGVSVERLAEEIAGRLVLFMHSDLPLALVLIEEDSSDFFSDAESSVCFEKEELRKVEGGFFA